MNKIIYYKKGFTLIETLIYIAIFVLISTVVMSLILSILETSHKVGPINTLSRAGAYSLEKITKDIRRANNIDILNSSFSASMGRLTLNTLDENGLPMTTKFYLESDIIKIAENGIYIGPLNPSDVKITSLVFNLATSSDSKFSLVKIEVDAIAGEGEYQKSEKFYSSAQLRAEN